MSVELQLLNHGGSIAARADEPKKGFHLLRKFDCMDNMMAAANNQDWH